jgi:hypothetical protein
LKVFDQHTPMSARKRKASTYADDSSDDVSGSESFSCSGSVDSDDSVSLEAESADQKTQKKGKGRTPTASVKGSKIKKEGKNTKTTKSPVKKQQPTVGNQSTAKSVNRVIDETEENSSHNTKHSVLPAFSALSSSSFPGMDDFQGPPATTDAAAKKLLLSYLKSTNRPFSLLQIHDNLHKRIQKASLERVLTVMSSEGILCKEYGKAKVYFLDQNTPSSSLYAGGYGVGNGGAPGSGEEGLEAIQEGNTILKEEVDELRVKNKHLQEQLNQIISEPNDAEIDQ